LNVTTATLPAGVTNLRARYRASASAMRTAKRLFTGRKMMAVIKMPAMAVKMF
jgi:hypothetical protein